MTPAAEAPRGRHRLPQPDLLACAVLLVLALGAVLAGAGGPAGAVVATGAVLFVPGYAVLAAAFGPDLPEWAARLTLACGLSVALAALGGVILHALTLPLTTAALLGWTLLVGFGAIAVALVRRRGRAPAVVVPPLRAGAVLAHGAVGLGLILAVVLLVDAARSVRPARDLPAGAVALWALPQTPGTGVVGLDGRNAQGGSFRVSIRSSAAAGGGTRTTTVPVSLRPGGAWRTRIALPPRARTEILLYRDGDAAVQARVVLPAQPAA